MPRKKQSIQIPEKVSHSMIDRVSLHSLNATMPDKETYQFLQKQLFEGSVPSETVFGTGELTYRGVSNSDETILAGICHKNPSKISYSIRLFGFREISKDCSCKLCKPKRYENY